MEDTDWNKASRRQLLDGLLPENARLRAAVARLMKDAPQPCKPSHPGLPDDFVPPGWAERHAIKIPRADGFFESGSAWVRVAHGVITGAGLKNQSILSQLIRRGQIDAGYERQASVYSDWRAAFFARVEAARYSDAGTGDPDAWSKEDRYSKLLKAVGRDQLRYVDAMVTARPRVKDLEHANKRPGEFAAALERTAGAMDRINRDADDDLKKIKGA